jgi:putative alpha-1,2-mannosidase
LTGKDGLKDYNHMGYVPTDRGNQEGVSRTLDFAFADFATAQAYKHLAADDAYLQTHSDKKQELIGDAERLTTRVAKAVPSQFSHAHGLMLPKKFDGSFAHDFSANEWGKGYVEGNSWHHSFPPYALDILTSLYGGKDKFLAKLHEMVDTVTSDFR